MVEVIGIKKTLKSMDKADKRKKEILDIIRWSRYKNNEERKKLITEYNNLILAYSICGDSYRMGRAILDEHEIKKLFKK